MALPYYLLTFIGAIALFGTVYAHSETSTPHAEITTPPTLTANQSNAITLKLTQDGVPLTPEQLQTVHTEKVHLLIIDPTLTDYHHIHPQPSTTPGEYTFTMTPNTDCNYRIWVDIVPVDEVQQYVIVDLPGDKTCTTTNTQMTKQLMDNNGTFISTLSLENETLTVGSATLATVTIEKDGELFTQLEPVMGAYAHLVGFYDDFETIAHVHPMGAKPKTDTDRAGPSIKFHIVPEQAGELRLFNQIQADGEEHFAMFVVEVEDNQ